MAVTVEIAGIDRTNFVQAKSLRKRDNLNERADTLDFEVINYGSKVYAPEINKEIIVRDGGDVIFGGVIVTVSQSVQRKVITFKVTCKDYVQFLDRELVTERFENQTLQQIGQSLIDVYAPDFTYNNFSGASLNIGSVAFNRVTLSECFRKLSRLTNYSWYVDEIKDVHFFSKNSEQAPFAITDDSQNYIFDSLVITEDLSQIRNSIKVEGGKKVGDEQTITANGDGVSDTFDTVVEFSSAPEVEVGGITQTVGVSGEDDAADFELLWRASEKTIQFRSDSIPASGTNNISMTGSRLVPVLVEIPSAVSIAEYGLYEMAIVDETIVSNEQAIERAKSELTAFAQTINDGTFKTYTKGLRSGQILTINSILRGKTMKVLIQSVSLRYRDYEGLKAEYNVRFASLRSLGIIDYLLGQLNGEELRDGEEVTLLNYLQASEELAISDTLGDITTSEPPYFYQNSAGTTPNGIFWNKFTWS